jgi:hypothetical protein
MDLDGTWEIGLAEIQHPHSWYEFILEFRPVLFPINGFNDPFGRGIVPIR